MAYSSFSSSILRRLSRNVTSSSSSSSSLLSLNHQNWCCSFLNQDHAFPSFSSYYCTSTTNNNTDSNHDILGGPVTNPIPLTTPKIFISGLSRLTTDEKLKAAFSPYGEIRQARVVTDKVTGRSKGFAFISYSTIEEAERAREGMNAKFLDGWVIFVDPAKPREPRPQTPPPEQAQPETGFRINKTVGWCG